MVRRVAALLLVVLLGLAMLNQNLVVENDRFSEDEMPIKQYEFAYVTHAPFNITSDGDFVSQAWPGNGSITNPYMIENLNITTNNSSCIWVMNTTSHFIIQNCLLESAFVGYAQQIIFPLTLTNVTNGEVRGNQIQNSFGGVSGYELSNCTIDSNQLNASYIGIDILLSNFTIISNNTQEFDSCLYGIRIGACWNCSVSLNRFGNITSNGIVSYGNNFTNFTENKFIATDFDLFPWSGITIYEGESCYVSENEISGFERNGIEISGYNHLVEHNNISAAQAGITVSTNTSIVRRNELHDNFLAIEIINANNTDVYENDILGERGTYEAGIGIHGGNDCNIFSNTIEKVGYGIILQGATGCNISTNIATNARYGFGLSWYGDHFMGVPDGPAYDCLIENNVFDTGGFSPYIDHTGLWDFSTLTFQGNTVNGRLIGFIHDLVDESIGGGQYGQLIIVNCSGLTIGGGLFSGVSSNVYYYNDYDPGSATSLQLIDSPDCTINNMAFTGNSIGIRLQNSPGCSISDIEVEANFGSGVYALNSEDLTITHSTFSSNREAIHLLDLWNAHIIDCNFTGNGDALYLHLALDCTITSCVIEENDDAITLVDADGGQISHNYVSDNDRGLLLNSTSDCVIISNTIVNSTGVGIILDRTSNMNLCFNNSIGWNSPNAICEGSSNLWDNEIDTGNYWSDYSGVGPYIIDDNDQDNFPQLYTIVQPTPTQTPIEIDPEVVVGIGIVAGVAAVALIMIRRRRVTIAD